MKAMCKKALCCILMVCTLSSTCLVFAAGNDDSEFTPMSSQIAVDANITRYGVSWHQGSEFIAYRFWIENTTNQTMTARIYKPNGAITLVIVPAGGNKSYVDNNAVYGTYDVTFSTSNNVLSGTVRVRVSTEFLS